VVSINKLTPGDGSERRARGVCPSMDGHHGEVDRPGHDEFAAEGLVDLDAPWAGDRLHALDLLVDLGATMDELREHRHDPGLLASKLVNGARSTMSRRELAERVGLPLDLIERLSLAGGLPDPGPDVASVNEDDMALFQTFAAAAELFGEETAFQLARVVGGSAAKMADAIVSAYRATIAQPAAAHDESGLAVVQSNIDLAAMRPLFMGGIEQLLKRHVANLARPLDRSAAAGYDTRELVVGFMDLVGSTALAAQLATAELSALLTEFESTSADIVVRHGGRVVKLIGDEVMFTNTDPHQACATAEALAAAFDLHPVITAVRVGLAQGEVLTRDGDCFGPVVNLAARVVGCAQPGQVLLDPALTATVAPGTWSLTPMGECSLKGISAPVALHALDRR
jgi:class 3 adenylate cyclase